MDEMPPSPQVVFNNVIFGSVNFFGNHPQAVHQQSPVPSSPSQGFPSQGLNMGQPSDVQPPEDGDLNGRTPSTPSAEERLAERGKSGGAVFKEGQLEPATLSTSSSSSESQGYSAARAIPPSLPSIGAKGTESFAESQIHDNSALRSNLSRGQPIIAHSTTAVSDLIVGVVNHGEPEAAPSESPTSNQPARVPSTPKESGPERGTASTLYPKLISYMKAPDNQIIIPGRVRVKGPEARPPLYQFSSLSTSSNTARGGNEDAPLIPSTVDRPLPRTVSTSDATAVTGERGRRRRKRWWKIVVLKLSAFGGRRV